MLPKKFFVLLALICVGAHAPAQSVKVKKEKSTVKGESMEGYSVDLDGTLPEVSSSFLRFLKTLGKARQTEYFVLNDPNINGLVYSQPVYGLTNENGKTASAWIGFNSATWQKADAEELMKELEKVMKDFGIKFYRDKIQVQIDESTKATQAVERQQQRLLNENKSLSNKLESNKREKINLEKAIEDNKTENITLLQKLEQNKKAQDSVAVAAEQIKKVVEMHKEKQRKVN